MPTSKLIMREKKALVKDFDKDVNIFLLWFEKLYTECEKRGKNMENVVEKLTDYIVNCDVPSAD